MYVLLHGLVHRLAVYSIGVGVPYRCRTSIKLHGFFSHSIHSRATVQKEAVSAKEKEKKDDKKWRWFPGLLNRSLGTLVNRLYPNFV